MREPLLSDATPSSTSRSESPTAADWAAARGETWSAQLTGMEAMLRPVDEPLLAALKLDAPLRIAEVGSGGGGTALEILRRAPPGSIVHGFDISPALVEQARKRVGPGEGAIVFERADMATAAPTKAYGRLVSRFGVMFFDDPRAAFANLVRWLAPGGSFAFSVWSRPSENPWISTARDVVARVVALPDAEPDAPGPFRYADAGTLRGVLAGAGLTELTVNDWRGSFAIGGGLPPAEAARFALTAFSSFADLLAKAGAGAMAEAHRALTALYSNHEIDGVVRMDACVHIVTGSRP